MMSSLKHNLKKYLSIILVFCVMVTASQPAFAARFSDTAGHWAGTVIEKWADYEILSGYGDGTVHPDDPITVAQLATIINKFMKYPQADSDYADVPKDQWYYSALMAIKDKGILSVDENNMAYPDKYLNREEAVMMIAKAFNIVTTAATPSFNDTGDISSEAQMYVSAMQSYGYVVGSDGYFMPKDYFTRAHIFTIIDAIIKSYVNEEKNYSSITFGNVLVNVPNATLSNSILNGDLYITPGVSSGSLTLDSITANKRVLVQGGGMESININNKTKLNGAVIVNNLISEVRFNADDTSQVIGKMDIYTDTILDGEGIYGDVKLNNSTVTVRSHMNKITIEGEENFVVVEENGEMTVAEANGSCSITGDGKVGKIYVNADKVTISITDAVVEVAEGVTGTLIDGAEVAGGATYISKGGFKSKLNTGPKNVSVTSVALDFSSMELIVGEESMLTATLTPSNATNKNISWSSSNTDVAIVNSNGVITALSTGEATITVTTSDGGRTASCIVRVLEVGSEKADDIVKFIVTFRDAETDAEVLSPMQINSGSLMSEPLAPSKEGSTFSAWFKDKACTERVVFPMQITSDITIYAQWDSELTPPSDVSYPRGIISVDITTSMLIPGYYSYFVTVDLNSGLNTVFMTINGETDSRELSKALIGNLLEFVFPSYDPNFFDDPSARMNVTFN